MSKISITEFFKRGYANDHEWLQQQINNPV